MLFVQLPPPLRHVVAPVCGHSIDGKHASFSSMCVSDHVVLKQGEIVGYSVGTSDGVVSKELAADPGMMLSCFCRGSGLC